MVRVTRNLLALLKTVFMRRKTKRTNPLTIVPNTDSTERSTRQGSHCIVSGSLADKQFAGAIVHQMVFRKRSGYMYHYTSVMFFAAAIASLWFVFKNNTCLTLDNDVFRPSFCGHFLQYSSLNLLGSAIIDTICILVWYSVPPANSSLKLPSLFLDFSILATIVL